MTDQTSLSFESSEQTRLKLQKRQAEADFDRCQSEMTASKLKSAKWKSARNKRADALERLAEAHAKLVATRL